MVNHAGWAARDPGPTGPPSWCKLQCTRRVGTDITLAKSSSGRHVAEDVLAELRGLGDRVISSDVTVKDVRHARKPCDDAFSYWSSDECRQVCSGSYVGRNALPKGDIPSYHSGLHVDVLMSRDMRIPVTLRVKMALRVLQFDTLDREATHC